MRSGPNDLAGNIQFRPRRPRPLYLFDGGVVDNMPVGKAAQAIEASPAEGPTQRVLLYLHPSPGVPNAEAAAKALKALEALTARGARAVDVLVSAARSLRTKSLVDDLRALEAHNTAAASSIGDRGRLLQGFIDASRGIDVTTPLHGRAIPELDAEQLADVLVAPWDLLAALEEPKEPVVTLAGKSGQFMEDIRRTLTVLLGETTGLPETNQFPSLARGSVRPWSVVIRTTSLLIEWCRDLENDGIVVGAEKKQLYDIRMRAMRAAAEMNWETLAAVPRGGGKATEIASAVRDERVALVARQLQAFGDTWTEVGKTICAINGARVRPESGGGVPDAV